MSNQLRKFLIVLLPLAMLGLAAEAGAQANDVDCNKCIDASDIAAGAINSSKIESNSISTKKLGAKAVTTTKIAPDAVTTAKIADKAVTKNKIKNGAVTLIKVSPKLKNDIGRYCEPGDVVRGKNNDGFFVCEPPGGLAATCDELMFTGQMFGSTYTGFDLRARTYSTLHFIGATGDFPCAYDEEGETLQFGRNTVLRALVDPGDERGDSMEGNGSFCCTSAIPNGVCNAPNSVANGSGVDSATALCNVLGYRHGTMLQENLFDNLCPEANALGESGKRWVSDFVFSEGYGSEYLCRGFK